MSRAVLDAEALAGFALVAGFCWTCGALLLPFGTPGERLGGGLLVLFGIAAAALAQRYAHASLLGRPWLLLAAALSAAGALLVVRRPRLRPGRLERWAVLPLAGAAGMAASGWWAPDAWFVGDVRLHRGWIVQLAGGLPEPTAIYRDAPSAYPWLYHALAAALLGVLPGGVAVALLIMQLVVLTTLGLGIWLLARELGLPVPAAALASLLALAGGGPPLSGVPAPTPALGNVAPALPRELGVAMAATVAWLGVRAARRGGWPPALATGAAAGITFITAPVAGLVCALWGVCALCTGRGAVVLRAALAFAAVSAVWLVALGDEYVAGRGFRRVSTLSAPAVGPLAAARTLAPLVVLSLPGLVLLRKHRAASAAATLCLLLAAPAVAYAAAVAAGDRTALGSPVFGREVRYLPFAALVLAIPAGALLADLLDRRGAARSALAVALASLAVAAPLVVSARTGLRLARGTERPPACFGAAGIGPSDTVAVVGVESPATLDRLAGDVFASTGATSLYHSRPRVRVRRAGPPQRERRAELGHIARGAPPPRRVDYVLAPQALVLSEPLHRRAFCRFAGRPFRLWERRGGVGAAR